MFLSLFFLSLSLFPSFAFYPSLLFIHIHITFIVTMGCCQSNEVHDGKARNEEIENQLKRDKLNMRNEVKMLLLGMYHSKMV